MSKEKSNKPFYKKWWVWVLAIFVLSFIGTGYAFYQVVNQAKDNVNELKTIMTNDEEHDKDAATEKTKEKDKISKNKNSVEPDYTEDQARAKFTMKELAAKYPVGTSYADYSVDTLGNIQFAEVFTLKDKSSFDVLIVKDGFVGFKSHGDTIDSIQEFATWTEVTEYVEKEGQKKKVSTKKSNTETQVEPKKAKINTSVFSYAESVDVTDAIDINQHVTIFVHMNEDITPGLAFQHVLNQSYDFLQQEDIKGAKTVTIAVKQGELKIAQITVNKDNFIPNDTEPMGNVVLKASEVDSMRKEVKEFGANLGSW